jgi:hypothetical protein
MTGAQASHLQTLSREAGEEFNETLTKAEASKWIEELQEKAGRGQSATDWDQPRQGLTLARSGRYRRLLATAR